MQSLSSRGSRLPTSNGGKLNRACYTYKSSTATYTKLSMKHCSEKLYTKIKLYCIEALKNNTQKCAQEHFYYLRSKNLKVQAWLKSLMPWFNWVTFDFLICFIYMPKRIQYVNNNETARIKNNRPICMVMNTNHGNTSVLPVYTFNMLIWTFGIK